jgi:hypothetical protein
MWVEMYETLVDDHWPHNPIFFKIAWATIFNNTKG